MLSSQILALNEEAGRAAAADLRQKHGLGIGPVADLPSFIEEAVEIDVRITDLPHGVDAVTVQSGGHGRILIGVGTTKNAERQRFSLAHELGHALFDDLLTASESPSLDPATEDRAHCFARHFLIPEAGIHHRLAEIASREHALGPRHLSALVQHFGVSSRVVSRQLHRLGLIDERLLEEWASRESSQLAVEFGWDSERAARVHKALSKRLPQRIAARATRAYTKGTLSVTRLAQLRRDDSLDETRRWVEESGLTVEARPVVESAVEIDDL